MQRQGHWSRLILYPESTYNSDTGITTGYLLPLVDQSGFGDSADPIQVPIYDGTMLPFDDIPGLIMAGGSLPLGLEYETLGHIMKAFFSANGYVRPGGGTTSLHHFFIPTIAGSEPGSFQLQNEFTQSTALFHRGRGVRPAAINYQGEISGFGRLGIDVLGSGSMVQTDLAGTKTDNGFQASNYFDGRMTYRVAGGTRYTLADITGFRCRIFNNASRQEAFFNNGIASGVNTSNINVEGALALAMKANEAAAGPANDLNFYNNAVNRDTIEIDLVVANGPLATCTKYKRYQFTVVRFFRMAPKPGGGAGIVYEQAFRIVRDATNAKTYGEYVGPTLGTYNIGAATFNLGVKVNGGATITTALTQGAARTVTQVVADLNANGALTAVADIEEFCGRVRISSKTKGSTSSIQIDTGVATPAHAAFGFDGVARSGRDNCPVLIHLFNSRTTDF
jgi:hypothetical protein